MSAPETAIDGDVIAGEMRWEWQALIAREPRLEHLRLEAAAVDFGDDPNFCANRVWGLQFKPVLQRLVGWLREEPDPVLGSSAAYGIAYRAIYEELPCCRNCGCL